MYISFCFFFFTDTATTAIYTLSHTTLFRSCGPSRADFLRHVQRIGGTRLVGRQSPAAPRQGRDAGGHLQPFDRRLLDRKSTRLNSSHVEISYAVFCLKKKKKINLKQICKHN